jgi:ketosteroid isomerase-like protein
MECRIGIGHDKLYESECHVMMDRLEIDRLLRGLYEARARGDLDAVCRSFSDDARFEIAGASHASPIAVTAVGIDEFRPLLTVMIKTFKLSDYAILAMIIDGMKAAVHWRATIHSRITRVGVRTELVDVVEVGSAGRINSYVEFFAPR